MHATRLGPARRKIHYEPVGVVGAITPWNVPFYLNIAETVPALMAGNTVVLKPAQLTPWSGSEYGRIVAEETDIPPGVFNVVVSNANEVGAALVGRPAGGHDHLHRVDRHRAGRSWPQARRR